MGQLASEVRQRFFQKFFIDYVGKFSGSKALNTMLLVCMDAFFNFVWMVPFREATTRAIIKDLQQRDFASSSVPEMIVTDAVACFSSQHFNEFCFTLGVLHITINPYYGKQFHAERFNHNLKAALIAYYADGTG